MAVATSTESGFRYQPGLDGVRVLAVLAVLGFHFGVSGGEGGYLGVNVFLVLSGFLITSLLAIERTKTGRIDFLHFWGRRIRRLLPALLVLLGLVGLYAWLVAPDEQLHRIRDDGLATLFYVQNWHLVIADRLQTSPLSHTWSLAIEEQWYLIWPPVFLALTWLFRKHDWLLLGAVLTLALASTAEMAMLGPGFRSYYGTDTQAQALLLGATLALLLRLRPGPVGRAPRLVLEAVGLVGLAVFVAMVVTDPANMSQGGYLVLAIVAAAIIGASVQAKSPVLRPLLSLTPLRWLGLISYGVYLYHFPILHWLNASRTGLPFVPLTLLRFTVTVVVATVSFLLIERPVRQGTFLPRRAQVVLAPVAVAVAILIVVITTAGPVAQARSRDQRLWAYARMTTPPDEQRVLLVGDREVFDLALAMSGPFDGGGVRGQGSGSVTCALPDLQPPSGQVRSAACRTRWTDLEDAIRAYQPSTIVGMVDPGQRTRAEAALDAIHRLRPKARVELVVSPTKRNPPALVDADLRAADGTLTIEGGRAIWRWIVDGLRDPPAP